MMHEPSFSSDDRSPPRAERGALRWLTVLAVLHGLLYTLLVPPWQHYDEPAHFEYAMQIALGEGAAPGPRSVQLSREIADSMYRHCFWPPGVRPDLLGPGPTPVGASQRVHPPLYYALLAVVLRPIRYLAVETQLYAARLASVLGYTLTVLAVWRLAVTVAPDEPSVQRALPALAALTPTFADLMTAVNNDVLLNLAATAALLGAVQGVRDGPRPTALALATLGTLVAVLTKRTGLALVPLTGLALLWTLRHRPLRPLWALGVGATALVAVGAVAFEPVRAAGEAGPHWVLAARPWLARLDAAYLRLNLDEWVRSVSDLERIGARYRTTAAVVFTSFWTRFGWGHVTAGPGWDGVFAGLTLAAWVGLARGAWATRRSAVLWRRRCGWLLVGAVALGWLAVFARLHPLPPVEWEIYIPRGRYMFWAMAAHLWMLLRGLQWLGPSRWRAWVPWGLVAFFVLFDVVAIRSIAAALH